MKDSNPNPLGPTHLGLNIRFLRKIKGLSQEALGRAIGLSRSQVASYETGAIEPRFETLIQLADYFDEDVTKLLSEDIAQRPVVLTDDTGMANSHLPEDISMRLKIFIKQTRDMGRVLEGYKTFYAMQEAGSSVVNQEVRSAMQNLFELLDTLIETNWKLIRSFADLEEE